MKIKNSKEVNKAFEFRQKLRRSHSNKRMTLGLQFPCQIDSRKDTNLEKSCQNIDLMKINSEDSFSHIPNENKRKFMNSPKRMLTRSQSKTTILSRRYQK